MMKNNGDDDGGDDDGDDGGGDHYADDKGWQQCRSLTDMSSKGRHQK